MVFLSIEFLIFFVIVLLSMKVAKKKEIQYIILSVASFVFYGWSDWRCMLLLLAEVILIYVACLEMGKCKGQKKQKMELVLSVTLILSVLGIFKYYNFFVMSFCRLFGISDARVLNLILPLGISFFTFQGLSMLFDVYYGKIQPEMNFCKVALGICFFPFVTSGPIVQARKFLPQLDTRKEITCNHLTEGIQIIVRGVFKKKVIADRLAVCVDAVYSAPGAYSGFSLLMAAITYSIQIYCDFSGYSDMAIGIGKMLGFDLGQNFNLPYFSKNTAEFWRRWHISLSTWFKDYVYIPLGGSRKGYVRTCFNLFFVMLLSGLWHGASWQFVFWGAAYGLLNVLHKVYADWYGKKAGAIQSAKVQSIVDALKMLLTFTVVTILWIFFRAETFTDAWIILTGIFTMKSGIFYVYSYSLIFGILLLVAEVLQYVKNKGTVVYAVADWNKFRNKLLFCIIVLVIVCFAYSGGNNFIYSQF